MTDGDDFEFLEQELDESTDLQSHREETLLIGTRSGKRYFALQMDTILAFAVSYFVVLNVPIPNQLLRGLSFYVGYLAYYFILEGMFGRTFGKWYFGLKVVTLSGNQISWRQSLTRSFLLTIECNPIFVGGLPAALLVWFTPRCQRLGDLLAGTVVVRT